MEDMVFLCTVENSAEALVLKSQLDDAGLRYRVDTFAPNIYSPFRPGFAVPMGPISFYIYRDDYNNARKLLNIDDKKD
jgi:hypothetical protein